MNDATLKLILQAVDKATGPLGDVSKGIGGLDKKTGVLGKSFDFLQNVAVGSLIAIGTAAIALSSGMVTLGISTAAGLETSEVGFATLLKSTEKAAAIMERIKIEAARTPFELPGLTSATQLLTSVTKDGDKALKAILDIGEGLAAMGKGQVELDRIIVNMQQIGAVGHASMVDIKQFAFSGIPIFELLQKETKLSGKALSDFISDGGVKFDLLVNMFDKANDAGGPFFNAYINQAGTFNQLLSNSKDAVGILSSDIVKQTGIFDLAKKFLSKFTSGINENKDAIISLVKNGITFLQSGFEQLEPVFKFLSDSPVILESALIGLAGTIVAVVIPTLFSMTVAALSIALPILALAGMIAGLYYIWTTNFGGMRDTLTNFWATIQPILLALYQSFVTLILPALMQLWNAISQLLVAISPLIPVLLAVVGIMANNLFITLVMAANLFTALLHAGIQMTTGLIQFITGFVNVVVGLFTGNLQLAGEGFKQMFNGLLTYVNGWSGQILAPLNSTVNSIRHILNIDLTQIGSNMIQGLINGITSKFQEAKNTVTNLAGDLANSMKNALGIRSPSRVFEYFGKMTGAGFEKGLDASMASPIQSMNSIAPESNTTSNNTSVTNNNQRRVNNITFSPVISGNMDIQELFIMFEQWLAEKNLLTLSTGI